MLYTQLSWIEQMTSNPVGHRFERTRNACSTLHSLSNPFMDFYKLAQTELSEVNPVGRAFSKSNTQDENAVRAHTKFVYHAFPS